MSEFPALSVKPDGEYWVESPAVDPTIRNEFEGGVTQTRPRFTSVPRKWTIRYQDLTLADKQALESLERDVVYGAGIFSWTNPTDDKTYQVRFGDLLAFQCSPENPETWTVDIVLVEAYPNSEQS